MHWLRTQLCRFHCWFQGPHDPRWSQNEEDFTTCRCCGTRLPLSLEHHQFRQEQELRLTQEAADEAEADRAWAGNLYCGPRPVPRYRQERDDLAALRAQSHMARQQDLWLLAYPAPRVPSWAPWQIEGLG